MYDESGKWAKEDAARCESEMETLGWGWGCLQL